MIKHYCDLQSYNLGTPACVDQSYSWFKSSLVFEIHTAKSWYRYYVSQGCSRLLASHNSVIHRAISLITDFKVNQMVY